MNVRLVIVLLLAVLAWNLPASAQVPQPSSETITNADVVVLVTRGLSDEIIVGAVRGAARISFDLSTSGLTQLKAGGVSDRIILVMQTERAARAVSVAPTPGPIAAAASGSATAEWQRRYAASRARAHSAKRGMAWAGVAAAGTVALYILQKHQCENSLTGSSPSSVCNKFGGDGMSYYQAGALMAGGIVGIGFSMQAARLSSANAALHQLETARPQAAVIFIDLPGAKSIRASVGQQSIIAYQLSW